MVNGREGEEVLWAKVEGKDIFIQEIQDSEATRFVSNQECHNALSHLSVQVFNQAMSYLYFDSHLILKLPMLSLPTQKHSSVPPLSYQRAENPCFVSSVFLKWSRLAYVSGSAGVVALGAPKSSGITSA